MSKDHCQTLASRFQKMAEGEGLVDVKVCLRNYDEAVVSRVCQEVESAYVALADGDFAPLNFRDSHNKS